MKDESVNRFTREKRITDAISPILSVRVPRIKLHTVGIYTVYESEFIPGRILMDLPLKQILGHRTEIGQELGKIIYILHNAKCPELNDMCTDMADDVGIIHGDMCSNILVNPDTMQITGIIDWEYARFDSVKNEFFGLFRVRRKMRLTDIAPIAMCEYYELAHKHLTKTE